MLGRKCSGSLYTLMEVNENATPQEIKRAYHRLALILHPDKTDGTTTEQFTRLQEAYSILSDEQQRRTYNTFGREGVATLNKLNEMNVPVNPSAFRFLCFLVMMLILLLLLQLELVVVRLDYELSWKWPVVFIPLWIALAPPILLALGLLAAGIKQLDFLCVCVGVEILLFVGSIATFVAGLCGALSWPVALSPAIAFYAVRVLHIIPHLFPSRFVQNSEDGSGEVTFSRKKYCLFVVMVLFEEGCAIAFFTLLMLRAMQKSEESKDEPLSFWIVFSPLIACLGLKALLHLCFCMICSKVEQPNQQASQKSTSAFLFVVYSSMIYVACMIAAKANVEINKWTDGFNPSAAVAVIPIQVIFISLFLASVIMFCTASRVYEAMLFGVANEEDDAERGATTPLSPRNTGASNSFRCETVPVEHQQRKRGADEVV
ncbi:chaperone protein DNAj, putative [Trypanosoma equiperdum]|uniref:Chaperone protein DNAj, putative n=1 Tax=Trypanosoma equiperdum TaxID=5694 RepID=A0A1G4IIA2_TRYEQ|nr:chaperone protein DNAj, putative [Trypanosoma equiperdum]